MAYDRAPRWRPITSSTGPNVGPSSYQATYEETCSCRGTNWAPFLSCASRKSALAPETPAPNAYFPKTCDRIIGGASLLYTAPRFRKRVLPRRHRSPSRPKQHVRLKGFMYHCNVPYTLLGYPPTIPNIGHEGYKSLGDQTLVECCDPNYDLTLGPAFYKVNFDTFGHCYRGCYWSRYSGRDSRKPSDVPGVGTYDLQPREDQPDGYLNQLRQERRKNAASLRYADQMELLARRNDYPAPNQYPVERVQCWRGKRIFPKKLIRPKKVLQTKTPAPAPNQYNDPRTAFSFLTKPSCKKGLSAFLTKAPRFRKAVSDSGPGPNQYQLPSFVDELAKKVSPYAVRNTAFDSSVPKRPETPEVEEEPCEEDPEPTPPAPRLKAVYPFCSKTQRFKPLEDTYEASCASYDVQKAFAYASCPRSFRKVSRYDFLFSESRFSVIKNFFAMEDKSYVPGHIYDINKYVPCMGNKKGSFAQAKRFAQSEPDVAPGPASYHVRAPWKQRTFNVTLMSQDSLTAFQQKTKARDEPTLQDQKKKDKSKKKDGKDCFTSAVKLINIEYPLKEAQSVKKKTTA